MSLDLLFMWCCKFRLGFFLLLFLAWFTISFYRFVENRQRKQMIRREKCWWRRKICLCANVQLHVSKYFIRFRYIILNRCNSVICCYCCYYWKCRLYIHLFLLPSLVPKYILTELRTHVLNHRCTQQILLDIWAFEVYYGVLKQHHRSIPL